MRIELNKFEEAGLLQRHMSGQKIVYQVNRSNPFYLNLVSIVSKYLGFDELTASLLNQVGELKAVFVVGDYAQGVDSGTIELILVGKLKFEMIDNIVDIVAKRINRKIIYKIIDNYNIDVSLPILRLV